MEYVLRVGEGWSSDLLIADREDLELLCPTEGKPNAYAQTVLR